MDKEKGSSSRAQESIGGGDRPIIPPAPANNAFQAHDAPSEAAVVAMERKLKRDAFRQAAIAPNPLLARIQAFLPQIATANKKLEGLDIKSCVEIEELPSRTTKGGTNRTSSSSSHGDMDDNDDCAAEDDDDDDDDVDDDSSDDEEEMPHVEMTLLSGLLEPKPTASDGVTPLEGESTVAEDTNGHELLDEHDRQQRIDQVASAVMASILGVGDEGDVVPCGLVEVESVRKTVPDDGEHVASRLQGARDDADALKGSPLIVEIAKDQ